MAEGRGVRADKEGIVEIRHSRRSKSWQNDGSGDGEERAQEPGWPQEQRPKLWLY